MEISQFKGRVIPLHKFSIIRVKIKRLRETKLLIRHFLIIVKLQESSSVVVFFFNFKAPQSKEENPSAPNKINALLSVILNKTVSVNIFPRL